MLGEEVELPQLDMCPRSVQFTTLDVSLVFG